MICNVTISLRSHPEDKEDPKEFRILILDQLVSLAYIIIIIIIIIMRYPDVIGLSRADLAALLVAFFSPLVPFVFPAAIMLVHGVLSRLL